MNKIWMKGNVFGALTIEAQKGLTDEELEAYKSAEIEAGEARLKELEESNSASKDEVEKLNRELNALKALNFDGLKKTMKALSLEVDKLKTEGVSKDSETFAGRLKSAFDKSVDALKSMRGGDHVSLKATATYGDIADGLDFAQMKPGITDAPVRRVLFRSLFGTIPVSTEYLKYTEQDTVIRDAQNVAKCDWTSSTTKETLVVRSIETKMIKDIMDFCTQFVADYAFMASRIRKLITESVALKVDQQLLLGAPTPVNEETNSINSVSSDFNAANPVCDISASIDFATLVDLILGMGVQIEELGLQNAYMPDTVLVNRCDWFVGVESRKNADGNYLDGRVTYIGGVPFIGGMRVLTSPLVAPNTLYVFDSTKGEIVDRGLSDVEISYENKDNWEKEIGSIKAYERLNFLVENNNANAFMRCLDIDTAITAINK